MTDLPSRNSAAEFERLLQFLQSDEARRMTHSELERFLAERGEKLTRMIYNEWLARRGRSADHEQPDGLVDAASV